MRVSAAWLFFLTATTLCAAAASGLRLATFDIDATPPVGSHMAYDPVTNTWNLGLRARGAVLLGAGEPIVLCAVDWIGIANEGHDAFRNALASAAATHPSRVAVHALHQHDAPDCDFSAERILKNAGMDARQYEGTFQRQVISNLATAVRASVPKAQPVTHLGLGMAVVEKVASNRRIFGADGKVRGVRYTACTDADLRAAPEGTIDPELSQVSFWNGDKPLVILSYYATHPQSYYRTGIPNPDFPGLARFQRDLSLTPALHVHFNGAGGNIGAGKYNDGAMSNRVSLAERVADGMRRAWESTKREPIDASAVAWNVESVALPPSKHLSKEALEAQIKERHPELATRGNASRLAWLRRCEAGHKVDVSCLKIGRARILHMPGELFVEYQLAAKAQRPDLFVAMAAYGDYAPWYIGTAVAYEEGGYETEPRSSNVAPEVEPVLMNAVRKLLADRFAVHGGTATLTRLDTLPFVENDYTKRFHFDTFTNPKLKQLRERYRLDSVIAAGTNEFARQVLLMDWVHRQFKKFGRPSTASKGALDILEGIEQGHTFFCSHYAHVMVSSAASLGWVNRELALRRHQGAAKVGGSTEHSVTEIWSNEHRKWVMLDPTSNMHLENDGVPLNAWEIREEWFYRNGSNLVFVVGGKRYKKADLPIFLRSFAGFGDLAVHADELDKYGFIGYIPNTDLMDRGEDYAKMFIVKDKLCDGTKWHVRANPGNPGSDPYFPIGQAALAITPQNGKVIVTLKTLTPNFRSYEAQFDNGDWKTSTDNFTWPLHPGGNRLAARTINEFGIRGPVSVAEIELVKNPD